MNYLAPRQRASDGRWDYTYNGSPWGYCREFRPFEECSWMSAEEAHRENEKFVPHLSKFHTTGHATKEEACECYKNYLLDNEASFPAKEPDNATQQWKCEVCGAWTACTARIGGYTMFTVCPTHCNREEVAKLLKIGESWES